MEEVVKTKILRFNNIFLSLILITLLCAGGAGNRDLKKDGVNNENSVHHNDFSDFIFGR